MQIITRAQWGAQPWNGTPNSVSLSRRTEFFVHHDGEDPITRTGYAIMRAIEATHLSEGWSGVGYNFVVDQAGNAYEGRGWNYQGAHCPDHNVSGIGVQVAIGGDQTPSAAALSTCRALYEEACERAGRTLAMKGHRDGFATECPGTKLYAWVQAGMPADDYTPAPGPGGDSGPGEDVARYQVTINGLRYGYGAKGDQVTQVGEALVAKGFGKHYSSGPGPVWTDVDTLNYRDYQVSLGFSGDDADGVPGESSLKTLLGSLPGGGGAKPTPPFPGREFFGPGKSNGHITLLGQQLVKKGFGRHYTSGPGPTWSDADRRNTQDFQLSRAELRGDADGLPGPLTWKLLFS
ncbi:peptidoglycan-binding protein (plasmid) [Streptomyces sp. NBC_01278]|uniref:peptidoglycan-binding protein n=1 Tax=Streptomyces sp. NBC_01278 TaxID=2903809 RepID=UPI002E345586|nr:peptidoglycan-binding protein [Streptomyces sp. NBC_01278]